MSNQTTTPGAEVRRGTLRWLGLNHDAEVVLATDHDRIVAAKDAELAGWIKKHDAELFGHASAKYREATLRTQLTNAEARIESKSDLQQRITVLTERASAAERERDAAREAFASYLRMLIEQYPSAQSIGGTYLTVLLNERLGMLVDSIRRLPTTTTDGSAGS